MKDDRDDVHLVRDDHATHWEGAIRNVMTCRIRVLSRLTPVSRFTNGTSPRRRRAVNSHDDVLPWCY